MIFWKRATEVLGNIINLVGNEQIIYIIPALFCGIRNTRGATYSQGNSNLRIERLSKQSEYSLLFLYSNDL